MIFLSVFYQGCISNISPVSNALSIYDIYSISRDQRGIYSISRDKFIQSKIQAKIFATEGLNSIDLEVESFYGNVYLIGLVQNNELMQKLIYLAKDTQGVRKIYTYLKIKQNNYPCNRLNILAKLKQNLFTDKTIEGTNVRVSIVGCDVVFSGVINSIHQEKDAIWYAMHIDGVENVYSFLKVLK